MATLAEIQARHYSFRAEADLDTGGWVIWFPDLPGCMSQAESFGEIGPMAREAFEAWTESAYERGLAIPVPSDTSSNIKAWEWGTPTPLSSGVPSLTAAEVANRLGVSVRRVSALAESRGTGARFGRYRLFSEDDVAAMQSRKTGRPVTRESARV